MKIDFSGKNVLVTGSSGGIGRAICIAFSELNARVHLHYNSNKEEAEKTIQLLNGKNHSLNQADLSNPNEAKVMVNNIKNIDIIVNNAALVEQHDFDNLEYDEWVKIWRKQLVLIFLDQHT